jgi:hypothetical protein
VKTRPVEVSRAQETVGSEIFGTTSSLVTLLMTSVAVATSDDSAAVSELIMTRDRIGNFNIERISVKFSKLILENDA